MIAGATLAVSLDASAENYHKRHSGPYAERRDPDGASPVASNGFAYFTGLANGTYVVEGSPMASKP